MKPRAYVCVKRIEVRHEAFMAGLKAAGYTVDALPPSDRARPGDVFVIWNRKGGNEATADRFERQGGTVLVAENGYLGKDGNGHQYYAIARHGHNGSGDWPSGGPERFDAMGVTLAPWRTTGTHVLVCPNRTFGMKGFIMPGDWAAHAVAVLKRHTDRPIRVRPHPGHWKRLEEHPDIGLARDLQDCKVVVIWASSAGVKALAAGVPVIRCAPWWVAAGAAGTRLEEVENPPMPDRLPAFQRLAWAQWSLDEIRAGTPFRHLLPGAQAEAA